MPKKAPVPAALRIAPFTVSEAAHSGITRGRLRGSSYRRLGSGLYRWVGLEETPHLMLCAFAHRLPLGAAFSGWTAAWLLGLDASFREPIEVTIPRRFGIARRAGASVRRSDLPPSDVVERRGLPTTSALRTVIDLGGRDPLTEGVVAADMALHARLVSVADLQAHVDIHPRGKGVARLRRVLDLIDPESESPMETRLRMLLVLAGLPRPAAQVSIRDEEGRFVARPDLLYRQEGLAIEYDGANHRDRLVADNRRQNALIGAGLRVLRFSAADVYGTPNLVVLQVRRALAES